MEKKLVREEFEEFLKRLGGVRSLAFWDKWRELQERLLFHHPSFQQFARHVASALPERGWVLQVGHSSDAVSLGAVHGFPERYLRVEGASDSAVQSLNSRLERFPGAAPRIQTGKAAEGEALVQGALVVDQLFRTEGREAKIKFLRGVASRLEPGGTLVLAEPLFPDRWKAFADQFWYRNLDWADRGRETAIREKEAVFSYLAHEKVFDDPAFAPYSEEQLRKLAAEAGLEVVSAQEYTNARKLLLVLRKSAR